MHFLFAAGSRPGNYCGKKMPIYAIRPDIGFCVGCDPNALNIPLYPTP